jgi:hypothetical protein
MLPLGIRHIGNDHGRSLDGLGHFRKVLDLASDNRSALATKPTLSTEKRGQSVWKDVDDVYHQWLLCRFTESCG